MNEDKILKELQELKHLFRINLEKQDMLIKLGAFSNINPNASQTESIVKFNKMGLKPNQIADALNTTQNYVNMILSKKRKEAN